MREYPYLDKGLSPDRLKGLSEGELSVLAEEIRRFLIDKVTKNGGHLASNLGVVELTLALHRVFDSPRDHFLWDVGHQSYVHKILTGRAAAFDSLRKPGGLSGFPTPRESEHDPFGTGHSSTSLSAALGFAEAEALRGSDAYTVAVVGDGAMTGGMVHEALNNCKRSLRTVIVLNDNEMSISPSTGLFSRYLSHIRTTHRYRVTKRRTKKLLSHIPLLGAPLKRLISALKRWVKRRVYSHNYFEDLGILYLGPVDGHNILALERALLEAKRHEGTVLVHVLTKKGKGLPAAESDPTAYHGISAANEEPTLREGDATSITFHGEAARTLCALAKRDSSVCAVTAAMGEGTGLCAFAEAYSDRFFDVGIAEEHALTFSAGLAANGMKPYFAVYSTFLQRAYDNLLHDVALQGLAVRLLVDRASLSVGDGATHHGIFDVAYASHIPHVSVWAPATLGSLRAMLERSLYTEAPLLIRYPNASEDTRIARAFYPEGDYEGFGARVLTRQPTDVTIISYGKIVSEVLDAVVLLSERGIRANVILLECLSPYAESATAVLRVLGEACPVLFVEEGIKNGGAGVLLHEALLEAQKDFALRHPYRVLAIDGHFAAPSEPCDLYAHCGIDKESIVGAAKELCMNFSLQI